MVKRLALALFILNAMCAATTQAQTGEALNFDGSNDVVYFPPSPTFNINIGTIEAWVRIDSFDSGLNAYTT